MLPLPSSHLPFKIRVFKARLCPWTKPLIKKRSPLFLEMSLAEGARQPSLAVWGNGGHRELEVCSNKSNSTSRCEPQKHSSTHCYAADLGQSERLARSRTALCARWRLTHTLCLIPSA